MSGGSWKVAYADFVTAMMAFFLLMWILNMTPKETKQGLAGYFAVDSRYDSGTISPVANNPLVQKVTVLDTREFKMSEIDKSNYAIVNELKNFLLADAIPSKSSGITSTNVGVLLHVTGDAMFKPNSVDISEEGIKILDEVITVLKKYKVFLVIRGHSAKGETGEPDYPSKWELSSARATAAMRYIIEHGNVDPTLIRAAAYADTRPQVPDTDPEASVKNGRVEFYFHRPEVTSSVVGS